MVTPFVFTLPAPDIVIVPELVQVNPEDGSRSRVLPVAPDIVSGCEPAKVMPPEPLIEDASILPQFAVDAKVTVAVVPKKELLSNITGSPDAGTPEADPCACVYRVPDKAVVFPDVVYVPIPPPPGTVKILPLAAPVES